MEKTKVRIAFHHVLDASLGTVKHMLIRIARLDVVQSNESRLGIQIDLLIKTNESKELVICRMIMMI
jgi:hypothetical protein